MDLGNLPRWRWDLTEATVILLLLGNRAETTRGGGMHRLDSGRKLGRKTTITVANVVQRNATKT